MVELGPPNGRGRVVMSSKNEVTLCHKLGVNTNSSPTIIKRPPNAKAVIQPSPWRRFSQFCSKLLLSQTAVSYSVGLAYNIFLLKRPK